MSGTLEPVSQPIFLVGAERSGTTVLRLMLDSHPRIAFCSEFEFVVSYLPEAGFPPMDEYRQRLENLRVFQDTGFGIAPALDYLQLVNSFLRQKQRDKPLVGATVHYDFDRLPRLWPDARYIHLVRDGRDVARSWIGMGWAGNEWVGAGGWLRAEETWDRLHERIAPDSWVELTFEDLITDHKATLTRVCEFLGVPYSEAMMDYTKRSTYEAPDPKLVGQWQRKMTDQEVRLVEARIGEKMQERGYALSGLPRLEVTPDMEERLGRQDRHARRKFRIKRYGLPLYASELVTRRLGLTTIHKRFKAKCNAVDQAHLK